MKRTLGRRAVSSAVVAFFMLVAGAIGPAPAAVGTPGTPHTWGSNAYGQLGDGTTNDRFEAAAVAGLDSVVDVAAGRGHAVALLTDGTVVTWGRNNFGQLGDGTNQDRSAPVVVSGLPGVVAVASGHYHSMALHANGSVSAWGFNVDGQLGDGTTTHRNTPVTMTGLTDVVAIAGGRDMSYALRSNGTVRAAGLNSDGQLGDGTTVSRTTTVRVGALDDVVDIAGGRDHGLAVDASGTVWAWGDNAYGQVGDGTQTDRTEPVAVGSLGNVVEVAAGAHHSYALLADGSVSSWGRNYRGQLGDGTTQQRLTPVSVAGVSTAVGVGSGRDHGLAVLDDGTVRAWGWNDFGQLGDGTVMTRTTAITVPNVDDAVLAHGGQDFTAVLLSDNAVDRTPPSRPGRPSGTSGAPGTITITWAASSDSVWAILTYTVMRDGRAVGSVTTASTSTVSFTDTGIVAGTAHSYSVVATDGAGNSSSPSAASSPIRERSPMLEDDFFGGTFERWTKSWKLTTDATAGRPRPSARAKVKNRKAFARFTLPQQLDASCVSTVVRIASQGDEPITVLRVRTGDAQSIARVKVNPNGKLVLRSDAARAQLNSGVKLGGGWVGVELCIDVPSGMLTLQRRGVEIARWVVGLGADPIGEFQLGESRKRTFTANFDNVVVDPID